MKSFRKIITLFNLLLIALLLQSCDKEDKKENVVLEMISEDINNKVNTQFLIDVASLNLKVVSIAQLANDSLIDSKTRKVVNNIETHHVNMNKRIKKIARKNLIIIPDTLYEETIKVDSLAKNRSYVYLVALEKLMKEEVEEFKLIKENTNNVEIEDLAKDAIEKINVTLTEIDYVLNNY